MAADEPAAPPTWKAETCGHVTIAFPTEYTRRLARGKCPICEVALTTCDPSDPTSDKLCGCCGTHWAVVMGTAQAIPCARALAPPLS